MKKETKAIGHWLKDRVVQAADDKTTKQVAASTLAGAAVGSFIPIVGTAAGAAVGATLGLYKSVSNGEG